MKIISKFSIAIAFALVLSVASLSVWAAPGRQQTAGPVFEPVIPITGGQKGIVIPVTGGTYEVTLLGNCNAKGEITRIEYLEPLEKEFGKAPVSLGYLTDGVKIELDSACEVCICYPYPKEYEDKNGQIYKWIVKDLTGEWGLLKSVISSDPTKICSPQKSDYNKICAVEKIEKGGIYDLIGNK